MMRIAELIVKVVLTGMIMAILVSCSNRESAKDYLGKVVKNLENIESATYHSKGEAWVPGDTAASFISQLYVKEYNNPADTTIGASFVKHLQEDTTRMTFCYDGKMRASIYECMLWPLQGIHPFLKQLGSAYNKENFSFVAIECTGRSMNALISYRERNDFGYPFLLSAGDVARDYQARSFPVFFILDKNRIIRKVIRGYGIGLTDQEIRKAIDEL